MDRESDKNPRGNNPLDETEENAAARPMPGTGGSDAEPATDEANATDGAPTDAGGVSAAEEEPIDPLAVLRAELEILRAQVAEAEAEKATLKDQLLRTLAESENQRKRHQRDKAETLKYAGASLAKELLSVADNLERALANIPPTALAADPALKALHEGVTATERELKSVLERHQVRQIVPLGEKFDSNFHQAMFEIESAEVAPGHVAQVLQPGYVMHDERLLRPALVAVAKAPKASND